MMTADKKWIPMVLAVCMVLGLGTVAEAQQHYIANMAQLNTQDAGQSVNTRL